MDIDYKKLKLYLEHINLSMEMATEPDIFAHDHKDSEYNFTKLSKSMNESSDDYVLYVQKFIGWETEKESFLMSLGSIENFNVDQELEKLIHTCFDDDGKIRRHAPTETGEHFSNDYDFIISQLKAKDNPELKEAIDMVFLADEDDVTAKNLSCGMIVDTFGPFPSTLDGVKSAAECFVENGGDEADLITENTGINHYVTPDIPYE